LSEIEEKLSFLHTELRSSRK